MTENDVNWSHLAASMLARCRPAEAFTALEIAAPATTPAAVAAALRALGAEALLYLHPTDPAARTAGALRLDATTAHLEVLANVPVTDPLCTDDPGWPAILAHFTSRVIVVATAPLTTLALPAVRTATGRYAAEELTFSYAASGASLPRTGPGTVGWLWPVPDPVAALALFMVRTADLGPADAVAAVQRWMLDPDRDVPPGLPAEHRATLASTDVSHPGLWAALAHRI